MEIDNLVAIIEFAREMKDNPNEYPELKEGEVIAHNGEIITL